MNIRDAHQHWAERLRAAMADRNVSMAELSRRSGVPYDSITKYLRGAVDQPRGETMRRISAALDVDYLWLRDNIGERQFAERESVDRRDPGPLKYDALVAVLRILLERLIGDDAHSISKRKLLTAAHTASDAWRALYRQGHGMETALEPTIKSLMRGHAGTVSAEQIAFTASVGANLYAQLAPLYEDKANA